MDYAHLMAVEHSLQDLLNAMTACKHQGRVLVPSVHSPPARPQPGAGTEAAGPGPGPGPGPEALAGRGGPAGAAPP